MIPALLADPLLDAALRYPLLLLLGGWLVLHRLPPKRRPSLVLPFSLYGLALVALLAAALAERFALPRVALARELAILVVGIACIRVGGQLLFRAALPAGGLRPPSLAEDLAVAAAYVGWALLRLSHNGVEPTSIVATSAVITGIVAFSLQETLANIFGGAALQLEDSIHLDDWVKVDDVVGRVVDIGWHSTLIETRNWETVVVPNAALLRARFTILGRRSGAPRQWRRWVWFAAGYGVPPQHVIGVVEAALRRAAIANVAAEPPPNCIAMEFGDSAVRYAVRYWLTDLAADDPTDSDVRSHVHAAFQRAGIGFPFPEATMHVIEEGEASEARSRGRELAGRIRALRGIDLFASLRDEELEHVAGHLVPAPFLGGETITRQGDVAHWLYILVRGEASVVYESGGEQRVMGTLKAGTRDSFFGEIGMLTGAPRSSSVVALGDVECFRLGKEGLEFVLRQRPAIAEEISQIMTRRRTGLAAARDALGEAARQRQFDAEHGELLGRIRRFFGLEAAAA
ncbi:MAG: cyclic nucleotide-binding domain-containing protein [Gammaproteobacteria bacterium]